MCPMEGFVRTVTGDVAPESLGMTYVHEHVLTEARAGQGEDMCLDDEERMAIELARFRRTGGGSMLEATTREFGRNPEGLRRLSERSGVSLVAVAGHQQEEFWRGVLALDQVSEQDLTEELLRDLTEGMEATNVKAGAIKVGTSRDEITATEGRMIRAAAAAQKATGAPIVTHTTAGTAALDQIEALRSAGADLSRVCIGHLDRRLIWEDHMRVAQTGVFLGYDQVSKDKYAPDMTRAQFVVRLADEGWGDRILLGGDMARRSYHPSFGGEPGFTYLIDRFLPLLAEHGLPDRTVRSLLVENPARLLAWGSTQAR